MKIDLTKIVRASLFKACSSPFLETQWIFQNYTLAYVQATGFLKNSGRHLNKFFKTLFQISFDLNRSWKRVKLFWTVDKQVVFASNFWRFWRFHLKFSHLYCSFCARMHSTWNFLHLDWYNLPAAMVRITST